MTPNYCQAFCWTQTDTQLEINSVVLFWPEGNDGVRPKGSQPKLARVIDLQTDSDGKQRKAKNVYTNAPQIKLDENSQLSNAPSKDSWRRIDQLIPVDDASQIRSVQAMLERASRSATNPSITPTTPAKPEYNLHLPQDTPLQHATAPKQTVDEND